MISWPLPRGWASNSVVVGWEGLWDDVASPSPGFVWGLEAACLLASQPPPLLQPTCHTNSSGG